MLCAEAGEKTGHYKSPSWAHGLRCRGLQGLPQFGGLRQGLRGSLLMCPRPMRSAVLLLLVISEPASCGHLTAPQMALPQLGRMEPITCWCSSTAPSILSQPGGPSVWPRLPKGCQPQHVAPHPQSCSCCGFKGGNKKHHTHAQPGLNLALRPLHIVTGLCVPRGRTRSPLNLPTRIERADPPLNAVCRHRACLRLPLSCPKSAWLQGRARCFTLPWSWPRSNRVTLEPFF